MMLYNDRDLFRQVVLLTSEEAGIDSGIIEKDYYVTMFLKSLAEKHPQIIFKGGTSLSKCYKVIKRFSEDIDLSLEYEESPTEGQRKKLKENIISTINEFGFELTNPYNVRSRRNYNKYIVDFPSIFNFSTIKQHLIVETSVFVRSYPTKRMSSTSLIYDYLKQKNREDIILQFALEPFELNVQDIERTFIDKIFAIGDYYLDNKVTEHSRHIYDIYKMFEIIEINDSLKNLLSLVQKERSRHPVCLSAHDDVDLKCLIQKIVDEDVYMYDYETITGSLLFEKISYETAMGALQKIINSGLLDKA